MKARMKPRIDKKMITAQGYTWKDFRVEITFTENAKPVCAVYDPIGCCGLGGEVIPKGISDAMRVCADKIWPSNYYFGLPDIKDAVIDMLNYANTDNYDEAIAYLVKRLKGGKK